jgi:hypothetical protein
MLVAKVLDLIVPKGVEYVLVGDPQNAKEYAAAITWLGEGNAPTWTQIQAGVVALDQASVDKVARKEALLDRLGITAEEAQLLLS